MRPPLSGSNPSRRPGSTDAGSETESRTSSGTFFTGDSARHPALQELEARIQRLAAMPQVIPLTAARTYCPPPQVIGGRPLHVPNCSPHAHRSLTAAPSDCPPPPPRTPQVIGGRRPVAQIEALQVGVRRGRGRTVCVGRGCLKQASRWMCGHHDPPPFPCTCPPPLQFVRYQRGEFYLGHYHNKAGGEIIPLPRLQVVRYHRGEFYLEHYDNKAGGVVTRAATALIYLADTTAGGGTFFPKATGGGGGAGFTQGGHHSRRQRACLPTWKMSQQLAGGGTYLLPQLGIK